MKVAPSDIALECKRQLFFLETEVRREGEARAGDTVTLGFQGLLLWGGSRLDGGEVSALTNAATEVSANEPKLLLVQSTAEVDAAVHIPVAVDILCPRCANTGGGVVSIGGSHGVVLDVTTDADIEVLVSAIHP